MKKSPLLKIIKEQIKKLHEQNDNYIVHKYIMSPLDGCPSGPSWTMTAFGVPSGNPGFVSTQPFSGFGTTGEYEGINPIISQQEFYESAGSPNPGDIIKLNLDTTNDEGERCVQYVGSQNAQSVNFSFDNSPMMGVSNGSIGVVGNMSGTYISGPYLDCDSCLNEQIPDEEPEEETDMCAGLEQHANSLGIQSGIPGVDGTTMSAADQFCIKCQAGSYDDPKCECCDTAYTYDNNVTTYDPDAEGIPPLPNKDKLPLKDKPKKDPQIARMQKLANIPQK